MKRAIPLLLGGALALGCGSLLGISDVPEPSSDAATDHVVPEAGKDVTSDVTSDVDVVPDGDATCGCDAVIPAGWTAVAFAAGTVTCPTGFGSAVPLAESPTAASGACDCLATQQTPPSCTSGSLATKIGASCNTSADTFSIAGSGCVNVSGTPSIASNRLVSPLPASGGSCTGQAQADPTKLSTSSATLCAPPTCPESLCAGQPPTGFLACISQDGDVACPASFTDKHLVADSFTLGCDCSSCTASASCDSATLSFYSDSNCVSLLTAVVADGACHATGAPSPADAFGSVKYAVNTNNVSYSAGPKTPIFTPAGAKTVCCPKT